MSSSEDQLDIARRYLDGSANEEDVLRLETLLRENPAFRTEFLRYLNIDSALAGVRMDAMSSLPRNRDENSGHRIRRTTVVLGLMFGLLCGLLSASLVWAMSEPTSEATTERLPYFFDGGFESSAGRIPSGFPREVGLWSGDTAEVVRAEGSAVREGTQRLRFVRPGADSAALSEEAVSCDVFQIVDLRNLRSKIGPQEDAVLELSADFLDGRTKPAISVTFICQLFVFTGQSDAIHAEWPHNLRNAIGSGAVLADSIGGVPNQWQRLTSRCLLPDQGDFAIVQLGVRRNLPQVELGLQFVDDVVLSLKTQPKLPTRSVP